MPDCEGPAAADGRRSWARREVGHSAYNRRYGQDPVRVSDVFNVHAAEGTTIQATQAAAPHVGSDQFDCIIFTQTALHRILKPVGVLLATFLELQTRKMASGGGGVTVEWFGMCWRSET